MRLKFALTTILLFFSGALFANEKVGCPTYTTEDFTLKELSGLIRNPRCQVKTIDDVIGLLPERMRSRMALFYRSQSLQAPHRTNYIYPRAILSSVPRYDGADVPTRPAMMLSFNGHPSQAGYERIELVDMKPKFGIGNVFSYHEISFPKEDVVQNMSWEQAQKSIQISSANPNKCIQCHGQPARPIFQQYPSWKGSFGARHTAKLTDKEVKGMEDFISTHSNNPTSRYRRLNVSRFKTDGFDSMSTGRMDGINDELHFNSAQQSIKINEDLSRYNAVRVATLISKIPFYSKLRFAIAGAVLECKNIEQFFAPEIFASLKKGVDPLERWSSPEGKVFVETKFRSLVHSKFRGVFGSDSSFVDPKSISPADEMGKECDVNSDACLTRFKTFWKNDPVLLGLAVDTMERQGYDRMIPEATFLRLLFEGQGVGIGHWWMDLKQPTYRTNSGTTPGWFPALEKLDPALRKPELTGSFDRSQGYDSPLCEHYARLSRVTSANYKVPPVVIPKKSASEADIFPAVFQNTCAKCHVTEPVGPRIPFNDPAKLNEWLRSEANAKRIQFKVFEAPEGMSMPPTRQLTREELKSISDYLSNFP